MSRRNQEPSLIEKMHAKDWRALPQDVVLAGDTKSSKRRRRISALRVFSVILLFGGIIGLFVYVWLDMISDISQKPEVRPVGVEFVNDGGVLDEAWFRAWTSFDETQVPDLNALRDRVVAYPQVTAARILRLKDGRIRVDVRERRPVARVILDETPWLVADDGILFPSETFPTTQSMLPLLQDVHYTVCEKTGFKKIGGLASLVVFIDIARTRFRKQFTEWEAISLKNYPADAQDLALPWAALRIIPRATSRNPAHAQIEEIVFSASRFEEDLTLFAAADNSGKIDAVLSAPNHPKAYRILFITNRKNPNSEFREMRMIPATAGTL